MLLYKYRNYEHYVHAQKSKTEEVICKVAWAKTAILERIVFHMQNIDDKLLGICHGVRNGWEVFELRRLFGDKARILGTEIADISVAGGTDNSNDPDIIQWDFHNVKEDWLNSVDFIYSNALDHSYDPQLCFERWMSCISKRGTCFIEWTTGHAGKSNEIDPFGANREEYREMFSAYTVEEEVIGDVVLFRIRR